ncbi:hypothetical protein PoB_004408400 [Plakobranchus ocellatus]|uniref:Uncharacterized protein n=1 Tax=Plakobranchus ocellatus TaxID=259542 RepID=A0AAV4BGV4_9GAST|nr:hypothetical protein PoB_004408400 [Plakobranchus ocellatus]
MSLQSTHLYVFTSTTLCHLDLHLGMGLLPPIRFISIYISSLVKLNCLMSSRSKHHLGPTVLVHLHLYFCSGVFPLFWHISIYYSAVVYFPCLGISRSTFLQWSTSTVLAHLDILFCSSQILCDGPSGSTFLQWSNSSVLVRQDLHFCSGPIPLSWSVRVYISAVVYFHYLGTSRYTFLQ